MQKFFEISAKLIFIVVLSIIYFYVKIGLTWADGASYAFILCAYLIFISTPYFTKNMVNKTVQNMPIYAASFIYLIVQIAGGVYVSAYYCNINPYGYVGVQSIVTGLYLIILLSLLYANETTYKKMERQQDDISYLRNVKTNLKNILLQTDNNDVKCLIEDLIDTIQSSPAKSNEDLYDLENKILDLTDELEILVKNSESAEIINKKCLDIQKLLLKRNNALMTL